MKKLRWLWFDALNGSWQTEKALLHLKSTQIAQIEAALCSAPAWSAGIQHEHDHHQTTPGRSQRRAVLHPIGEITHIDFTERRSEGFCPSCDAEVEFTKLRTG